MSGTHRDYAPPGNRHSTRSGQCNRSCRPAVPHTEPRKSVPRYAERNGNFVLVSDGEFGHPQSAPFELDHKPPDLFTASASEFLGASAIPQSPLQKAALEQVRLV